MVKVLVSGQCLILYSGVSPPCKVTGDSDVWGGGFRSTHGDVREILMASPKVSQS